MSRGHPFQPYEPGPSRLPWVVAFIAVAIAAAVVGTVLGQEGATSRVLQTAHLKAKPAPGGAFGSAGQAPVLSSVDIAATEETIELAPSGNQQAGDASGGPRLAMAETATSTPAPTVEPATTPTPIPAATDVAAADASPGPADFTSPASVIDAFAARWAVADYAGVYDLLTSDVQKTIAEPDFIDRYTAIAQEAGLTAVQMTAKGGPGLDTTVAIHVIYTSSKFGKLEQDNTIQLRKQGEEWRVAWTPSLIFADLADGCIDYTAEPVQRGSILDRNGDPLAYNGLASVVGIIPGQIKNESQMLKSLSKLIGMPANDIKQKYKNGQPDWFMPVKLYPKQISDSVMSGLGQLDGVAVRSETARVYPLGPKAAHITGYVTRVTADDLAADPDGALDPNGWVGRAGLEAGANDLLSGKSGGRLEIVDCDSRVVRKVLAERRPVPSQDLILTIDKDFQTTVDSVLGEVKGSAVVLDPRNGAVLAMVSHPSYDPNWFVTGFSGKDWAFVNNEQERPLLNRAAEAGYPTGSIFKVITMSAALADLDYDGQTQIDCPQEWSIPGTDQIWRDWTVEEGVGAQGTLTLHQALVNSCNTVFYQIGAALDEKDDELLPAMAKAYGLGEATGIPYLPEYSGIVPSPEWKLNVVGDYWARGDAVNLSIGQGYLEATPLQMANVYTAIANGGHLLQPFVVEFTQLPDGTMTRVGKRTVKHDLPLSSDQIAEVQSALRDQTSDPYGAGSYRVFGDMTWPIAGKTGTAQNQLDRSQKPHSWFAAFGPYGEKATISSIVMVESSGEGVSFAAPRTRQIYDAYLQTNLAETTNKGKPPRIEPSGADAGGSEPAG